MREYIGKIILSSFVQHNHYWWELLLFNELNNFLMNLYLLVYVFAIICCVSLFLYRISTSNISLGFWRCQKVAEEERAFARAEIENARAVVQRIEEALHEQEKKSKSSEQRVSVKSSLLFCRNSTFHLISVNHFWILSCYIHRPISVYFSGLPWYYYSHVYHGLMLSYSYNNFWEVWNSTEYVLSSSLH